MQYPHISPIIDAGFLASLAIPTYGPQIVVDILHSLQYPHIDPWYSLGFYNIPCNTRIYFHNSR